MSPAYPDFKHVPSISTATCVINLIRLYSFVMFRIHFEAIPRTKTFTKSLGKLFLEKLLRKHANLPNSINLLVVANLFQPCLIMYQFLTTSRGTGLLLYQISMILVPLFKFYGGRNKY